MIIGNSASALPAGLTQAQPAGATGGENLDQAAFLRLMTAQLRFQDPFDPVDNQAMVAQMAQFSSVAGIAEMNVSLQSIANAFEGTQLANASQFIGRSALVTTDIAAMDPQGGYSGEVEMAGANREVNIALVNQAGETVRSQTLQNVPAGTLPFRFDSLDDDGNPVDLGPLQVRVTGGFASQISTWVPVSSVSATGAEGNAALVTPIGEISTRAVRRIG